MTNVELSPIAFVVSGKVSPKACRQPSVPRAVALQLPSPTKVCECAHPERRVRHLVAVLGKTQGRRPAALVEGIRASPTWAICAKGSAANPPKGSAKPASPNACAVRAP